MRNPPFTPVHALKAGTNRHTTLKFFQPSMCSHWSTPPTLSQTDDAGAAPCQTMGWFAWREIQQYRTLLWANNIIIHKVVYYKLKRQMHNTVKQNRLICALCFRDNSTAGADRTSYCACKTCGCMCLKWVPLAHKQFNCNWITSYRILELYWIMVHE